MRTLQSFLTVSVLCASFAALLAACSSSDTPTPSGTAGAGTAGAGTAGAGTAGAGTAGAGTAGAGTAGAGTAGAGTAGAGTAGAGTAGAPAGNAANGATLYSTTLACTGCHGDDAAGGLGPNITPSVTAGIGGWTEAQFAQLMRNGIVPSGMKVCTSMAQYNTAAVSDQGVADIFAYLQSKPANDTVQQGSLAALDPTCNTH